MKNNLIIKTAFNLRKFGLLLFLLLVNSISYKLVAQADSSFTFSNYNSPLPNNNVTDIIISKDGKTKWIATWGGGITKFVNNKWLTLNTKNSNLSSDFINQIKQDLNGNIWCATNQKGVDKFDGKKFTNYTIGKSNTILSIGIKQNGNVLVGTYNEGLFEISNNEIVKIWGGEDALKYAIESICIDKNNSIWISTGKGIYRSINGILFQKIVVDSTQKKQKVNFGLDVDSKGNIWCASFPLGTLYKWDGFKWNKFEETATQYLKVKTSNPSKEYFKHAFYIDKNDNVYLASQKNSLMKFDGLSWSNLTTKDQSKYAIATVAVDSSGNIFSGSWGNGLMQLKNRPNDLTQISDLSKQLNRTISDKFKLTSKSTKSTIAIYDHGVVDGDIVSLYLNDVLITDNYTLTAKKMEFEINLQPKSENRIVLVAHNLGTQPPNTTSLILTIDGKSRRFDLNNDLKRSTAIVIKTE